MIKIFLKYLFIEYFNRLDNDDDQISEGRGQKEARLK